MRLHFFLRAVSDIEEELIKLREGIFFFYYARMLFCFQISDAPISYTYDVPENNKMLFL